MEEGGKRMPRERCLVEQNISHLREAEVLLARGQTVGEVCRHIGYRSRATTGGVGSALNCTEPPGEGNPLDRAGRWPRPSPLGSARCSASGGNTACRYPHLQALQRPRVRRQAARHRRPLHEPAGPRDRAVHRRNIADPGARPHPARPTAQARKMWHHDP